MPGIRWSGRSHSIKPRSAAFGFAFAVTFAMQLAFIHALTASWNSHIHAQPKELLAYWMIWNFFPMTFFYIGFWLKRRGR
jgi:hypothetical protein